MNARKILVLGASGLIGRFVTDDLRVRGFQAIGVARHFAPSQRTSAFDLELPVMSMDASSLARLFREREIDVVVNCLGVLQDGPGSDTGAVHRDFVERLLPAIRDSGRAMRLIHISIPGVANEDRTAFSMTKREAERLIAASGIVSRDPAAGIRGGAICLWRQRDAAGAGGVSDWICRRMNRATPFQPVAVEDIAATIAWLAARDIDDAATRAVTWDLMQPQPITLGNVIEQFRWSFGTSRWPRITLPGFLLDLGAEAGDLANYLGWMPPMRSTAIAELRRGVTGDPAAWMAATGIVPKTLAQMVGTHAATIQDKWFARLFLVKALVIASLALFWVASGFIALVVSFSAAGDILRSHGFPAWLVAPMTAVTSLMDISVGVLIAFRRTAAIGLIAGIVVSLGYMAGAAILTPDLWIEPLGALVKTGPAIVLMLVALLTLDNR